MVEQVLKQQRIYGDFSSGKTTGKHKPTMKCAKANGWRGTNHGEGCWLSTNGDTYIRMWEHSKAKVWGKNSWVYSDYYKGGWRYCMKESKRIEIKHRQFRR